MEESYNIDYEVKKILNQDNDEPIILLANNQIPTRFEKVALIPYKKSLYTILSPIDTFPGIKKDETLVLKIIKNDENLLDLNLPNDSKVVGKIQKLYKKGEKILNLNAFKKEEFIF